MGVVKMNNLVASCDSCGVEEKRYTSEETFTPDGWETRYRTTKRIEWDWYMKLEYSVDGYDTLLVCTACKNKYLTWEQLRGKQQERKKVYIG